MALGKRINPFLRINNDTGFGVNASSYGGRFINKDGSFNLKKEGLPVWQRFSIFHTLLNIPRWKFIAVIILSFIIINLTFTFIYLFVGVDQITGIIATNKWQLFKEVYFFSTQTFSTVGYGRVNPIGGEDNHNLTNVEVKVNLSLLEEENGKMIYKFYDLPLERSRVDSLSMNFTVVHPIDENSPLQGFAQEDMQAADVEVYVLVRGFDDVYSTTVLQRTSYTYDEIKFNVKFVQMYRESEDRMTTILELHKLNEFRVLG